MIVAAPGRAYITGMGVFLPGLPVDNDGMEAVLGMVNGKPSRLREKILRSNGILTRHYAMDANQRTTHQNSNMAAAAARRCMERVALDKGGIDLLAVASTQGDLPLPGMASMVQAELALPPCEIASFHGVCTAGMQAVKSAVAQVRLGDRRNALVCASELSSRLLKGSRYEAASNGGEEPDFEAEFLRWMLSDGAGAMLLQGEPAARGLSLRVEWIEAISFAGDLPLCMSCGTSPEDDGFDTWQDYPTYADAEKAGALLLRQNLKVLDNIVKVGLEGFIRLVNAGKVRADEIDHFVCHYSSKYFRGKTLELMRLMGCVIPEERWFTNLYEKGNTGCAALFIMLEELLYGGRLKPGQTVFCFVPESGRFNTAYMRLTVVEGGEA